MDWIDYLFILRPCRTRMFFLFALLCLSFFLYHSHLTFFFSSCSSFDYSLTSLLLSYLFVSQVTQSHGDRAYAKPALSWSPKEVKKQRWASCMLRLPFSVELLLCCMSTWFILHSSLLVFLSISNSLVLGKQFQKRQSNFWGNRKFSNLECSLYIVIAAFTA